MAKSMDRQNRSEQVTRVIKFAQSRGFGTVQLAERLNVHYQTVIPWVNRSAVPTGLRWGLVSAVYDYIGEHNDMPSAEWVAATVRLLSAASNSEPITPFSSGPVPKYHLEPNAPSVPVPDATPAIDLASFIHVLPADAQASVARALSDDTLLRELARRLA